MVCRNEMYKYITVAKPERCAVRGLKSKTKPSCIPVLSILAAYIKVLKNKCLINEIEFN